MATYAPLLNTTHTALYMLKTTVAIPADGDWDSQDGAVIPYSAWGSLILGYAARLISGDIHVVFITGAATTTNLGLWLAVFDPGTDTWTTRAELIADVSDTNWAFNSSVTNRNSVDFSYRSDGDLVVVASAGYAKVFTRDAGAWTSRGFIAGSTASADNAYRLSPPDTSDLVTGIIGSANGNIKAFTVTAANAISSASSVDASSDNTSAAGYGSAIGDIVLDGSTIYASYIDAADTVSVSSWTSGASFTPSNVTGAGDNVVYAGSMTANRVSLANDGDNRRLFYIRASDGDVYHDIDTGSGWGTDNVALAGAVTSISISPYGSSLFGILYNDAGTTKYIPYMRAKRSINALSEGSVSGLGNSNSGPYVV